MQLNVFTLALLTLGMIFLIAQKCGLIDKLGDGRPKKYHRVDVFDLTGRKTGPTGLMW
jgi:hypothetical protein